MPEPSLWEEVAEAGTWCKLVPGDDFDVHVPMVVIREEAESWAFARGLGVAAVIDQSPPSISIKFTRKELSRKVAELSPLHKAVIEVMHKQPRGRSAKALLAELDQAGHAHLIEGETEHARNVRLGRMLGSDEWKGFVTSRMLNGSRIWRLGPAEGVAFWDPRARQLTIEFHGEKRQTVDNVASLSDALEERDIAIIGDVHEDPDTHVQLLVIVER